MPYGVHPPAGEVWAWGMAGEGQLGIGEPSQAKQTEPRLVKALSGAGVVALAAGDHHSMALTAAGEVYTWGRGDHGALGHGSGQLGVGDDEDRWQAEQVMRLHTNRHRFYDLRMSYIKPWRVLCVSAGRNHSAAVVETELDVRDLAE
ncbi:putative E3 ubiquitin-protein ligase [Tetrabaena socialis]|uniref:Putative E3 ubiquitin-protein ligase n=1 Tax=Tetrabaena socialis TaxID=47790 RepID=A0A2J7ZSV8_9CHLO|nr:putative E3 ubiquitin-protein ligase [Tetrabaena socialis]|eukprot:PNH03357.1 putative E3 ubiquitin-protein ligase [Tetrabaena socialis]